MRQILIILFLCSINGFSQVQQDSLIAKKVSSSWYARSMFVSLTNTGLSDSNGVLLDQDLKSRITKNIEVGKSFGVLDVGLCVGSINTLSMNKMTNSIYYEGKLTMDACQYGFLSNEITIGGGYIPNKEGTIILELSSTIFAQMGDNWGVGVVYGAYQLSNNSIDLNKTFTGVFLRYGLLRDETGTLLNRIRFKRGKVVRKVKMHR